MEIRMGRISSMGYSNCFTLKDRIQDFPAMMIPRFGFIWF